MFKDSHVTKLTPWSVVEESAGMPSVNYPVLVGTGSVGVGLDAAGLQSLPDRLTEYFGCSVKPFHTTQSDLYVLHEGMISEHLWQDEVHHTGQDRPEGMYWYGQGRNLMPLGYITQRFEYGGKVLEGEAVTGAAFKWRREWDLRRAIVRNSFALDRRIVIETEVFAPHGGERVYIRLRRGADPKGEGDFRWTVRLPLDTRHGLRIFDQPDAVKPGRHTILATIDGASKYKPTEPYAVVYGVAADGMEVDTSEDGWSAMMTGPVEQEQVAWLKLAFARFAGDETPQAESARRRMEKEFDGFDSSDALGTRNVHFRDYERFWSETADIEVEGPDAFEIRRRYMLHLSEYMFHCGNDFSLGGTLQFLLFHQNGWGASNFHDHQYVVDGIARANMWGAAEANARWMRRVMAPEGRAFPWMMTYDGSPTVTPERDRAPMSDANRAVLAMRVYELAGRGREELLREVVYPIIKRVADMAVDDWFYEEDGQMLLRGIETDVMGSEATVHDTATVIMFLSVLRKALEYSAKLGLEDPRRPDWERLLGAVKLNIKEGRYVAHPEASPGQWPGPWLRNIYYIAEAGEFLDDEIYARTCDRPFRSVNLPWIGFAAASSEAEAGPAEPGRAVLCGVPGERRARPRLF